MRALVGRTGGKEVERLTADPDDVGRVGLEGLALEFGKCERGVGMKMVGVVLNDGGIWDEKGRADMKRQ